MCGKASSFPLQERQWGWERGNVASLEGECLAFAAPQQLFLLLYRGFLVGGHACAEGSCSTSLLQQKPSLSEGIYVIPDNG